MDHLCSTECLESSHESAVLLEIQYTHIQACIVLFLVIYSLRQGHLDDELVSKEELRFHSLQQDSPQVWSALPQLKEKGEQSQTMTITGL